MTAKNEIIYNGFCVIALNKDAGTVGAVEFERFALFSSRAAEQSRQGFDFAQSRKKNLSFGGGISEICAASGELRDLCIAAQARKTIGNRRRGVKFINPPVCSYGGEFLAEVYSRKFARSNGFMQSFNRTVEQVAATAHAAEREQARKENIKRVQARRMREQREAEAEREKRQSRLAQAMAEEKEAKRKQKIKVIILACVGCALALVAAILYFI